ncbi:PREDICTED: uncharacterized protein LOC109584956 [Amphimedon queenslandica]|uniref:AAA+ ATPase domain-containing protein n=1 Tax=Amphimedon queenslandica TaxID=400682 RepID=A0AAN0JID2_AMPQE|nr:PREDICTED: uncharacterized protein LOC109584956 [Amphimedon queenslandica]|eukprot:XP_019856423.1 PREDICTED: uncharacterized protein LOC109584956 [Amphimedon queenslandica]
MATKNGVGGGDGNQGARGSGSSSNDRASSGGAGGNPSTKSENRYDRNKLQMAISIVTSLLGDPQLAAKSRPKSLTTIEEMKVINLTFKQLSPLTNDFIRSLKQPNDFFDIIEKKYCQYYDCIMKIVTFGKVLKFDVNIEVAFNDLNELIKKQLEAFQKYPSTKSIKMLREAAFTAVQSSCNLLRSTMEKRLEAIEKKVEVLIRKTEILSVLPEKIKPNYLDCVVTTVQTFYDLEQRISLAFDAASFSEYLAKITEAIDCAEILTKGTLLCLHFYQFGVVSKDENLINLTGFYSLVSWIASDACINNVYLDYFCHYFPLYATAVLKQLSKDAVEKMEIIKNNIQKRKKLVDNKKTAAELKKILSVSFIESSDFPSFYEKLCQILESFHKFVKNCNSFWFNGGEPAKVRIKLVQDFAVALESEFHDIQLNNFRKKIKLLDQSKIQQSNPNSDLLAIINYSQNCLDSLAFLKQIDISYQSISERYDKMNEYEEASITALTNALEFSQSMDDIGSLNEQISSFKKSLMLDIYCSKCSKENLETVIIQVNALIKEIQEAASSLFDKRDMYPPQLRDLIKPQGNDLLSTHTTFNFKVIVRKEDWKLEENTNFYIAMAFYIPNHGEHILKLEFRPSNIEPEYSIMSCGVAIKRSFQKLYYKYLLFPYYKTPAELIFIQKPQYEEASCCYRVLDVPRNIDKKEVFDSCIYPQVPDKEQGRLSKWWHGTTLKLPASSHSLDFCAQAHLGKEYDNIKQCEIGDAVLVCEKILSVHQCLSKAYKVDTNSINEEMAFYNSNASQIIQSQLECLLAQVETCDYPSKIISGIVLCRCLVKISPKRLTPEVITTLLSTMTVNYDSTKSCYLEFEIVKSAINTSKWFIESLHVCISKAPLRSFPYVLKVLPLYHWFCEEFSNSSLIQLNYDADLLSQMIEGKDKRILPLSINSSDLINAITQLEPVQIEKDPLLQIQLVKMSSKVAHFSYLMKYVALQIILVDLGVKLKSKANVEEITEVISLLWQTKDNLNVHPDLLNCLKFLFNSLDFIAVTLHALGQKGKNAVVATLKLLLLAVDGLDSSKKKEQLQHVVPFIRNWAIVNIGEKFSYGRETGVQKEYQFWADMYSFADNSLEWKKIIQETVFARFDKIQSFELMVKLFNKLTTLVTDHDIIDVTRDCLVAHISSATDKDLQLVAGGSVKTQSILTHLIDVKFPSLPNDINTLFEWDMWPVILKGLSNIQSDEPQRICKHVRGILEDLCSDIKSGNVTVEMLLHLKMKWNACIVQMMSTLSVDQHRFLDDMRFANKRVHTLKIFLLLVKEFASSIPEGLSSLLVKANDLLKNHQEYLIKSLCNYDDGEWDFPLFPEAKMITPMLVQFAVMNSEGFKNDIFYYKKKQLEKSVTQESSLEDVCESFWVPLFDHCCTVADELKEETITLSNLSSLFGSTESADSEKTIERLLSAVEKCHAQCTKDIGLLADLSIQNDIHKLATFIESEPLNMQWVKKLGKKITDWSNVQALSAEADYLMEIIKAYDLNQSPIYRFSKQGIHELLQQMLKSVTDDDNKVLLFLKKIRLVDAEIKESVKELGQCKDLRSFIKSKSKDVSEMERFIQIALDIVAGDGAEMQDRLIDLSELCGKFYPLLYQLDSTTEAQDVDTIQALFQQTWESLKTHGDPLTLTKSCISNVEWYKFIGQLQGAGEQGTVKQLNDLNEHGEYTVSTTKDVQECTVSLTINSVDPHISKKFWTLDDLHEIESKLVLITRQTSKWVDAKNLFQEMLSRVCQICDVVQKLKEYGHMKYLVWQRTLACSDFVSDLASLDKQIEELEQTLSKWIGYVWRCRHQYSELNYYKTNQLIVLREELTKVDQDENHEISLQVFHLLNSTIGKPLESELIVRKALKGDVSLDDESLSVKEEFTTTESAPPPVQSVETNIEPEEISKVSQSLAKVRSDDCMNKLYEEADVLGYPEYLILEALLNQNITDIFDMMEWYDELTDDDTDKYQKEWMVNHVETKKNPLSTTESATDTTLCHSSPEGFNDIDINHVAKYFFKRMENSIFERTTSVADETDFVSLENLGRCLQIIAARQEYLKERHFLKPFEQGVPNLVITSADNIFICTLQIYSAGDNNSLPTFDEVFTCSESTTLEEVTIFWMRVLSNQKNNQIYCLLHGEKLPYLIAEESLDLLKYLSQGNEGYKLVIICSNEEEGKSNVISRLYSYRREWNLPTDEDMEQLEKFLWQNIIKIKRKSYIAHVNAADVDTESSQVRVFTSKQAGVGKSLSVRKLKDKLVKVFRVNGLITENQTQKAIVTLPLHGPVVTADEVLSMLLKEGSDLKSCIIHLDIPIRVLRSIDDIIFSLLILGGLTDSKGNVWRTHPSQLYAIELTLPSTKSYIWEFSQTRRVINLLKLFPNTECPTPKQLCDLMTEDSVAIELRTPMYQRVYQYLRLLELEEYSKLEKFIFVGTLEGSDRECLDTIIRHSNISIPTWKEVRHFVWFLNIQLSACEQSNIIKRVPGLRTFVVDFMTTMSRDFATSSMSTESTDNILNQHVPRRRWDESMHPYLFFNKNRTSVTHVGLQFETKNSQIVLQDTYTQKEIKADIAPELFDFLTKSVKIPLQSTSNCSENELDLIERLLEFMNIKTDEIKSPDETYVLTQDNLTKIMAIQTRFRCQIPVVLMGETGCGKTHLIRFMCKFATYNKPMKNMFILKVHGGTTEEDVIQCVNEAETAALENRKHKIDTVVFFDEANTSDVISLIKEIMCDGRCRGKLVPPFLKFVAACNPYRKHSHEMIKKLRGAGLGWRDEEASNNAEKLGEIPLRDLVYRVLELPDSMKALIYDFGQLKYETERDYILQMARNKLQKKDEVSHDCVIAIGEVLAKCQDFSKQMKDECSFVSLRDVDRVLVLFIYFLDVFTDVFQINGHDNVDKITQSLLLALSVAYLARMASRDAFMTKVLGCIKPPLHFVDLLQYKNIVKKYQEKLLDCMEIENNIAKNAALRENIFMMFVCIELRVPLFLVGKPGSSKSLAKAIIENSLKGKNSKKQQ